MPLYLQNFGFLDATGLSINPNQVFAMTSSSGTNVAGNNMTFKAGSGTGSGLGGSFVFQVAGAGVSGSGANSLSTALTIASDKNITAYGDLTVSGKLTVNGSMTTVDSTTVTVQDPVFYLAKGQYSDTSTKLDRGIIADYNDGVSNKLMFFGYDRTQDLFTFIPNASDNTADGRIDGNFTGAAGAAKFGALTLTNNIAVAGASTLTGAMHALSTAVIDDTLTLSKSSGTGLSVAANAHVGGALDVVGSLTVGSGSAIGVIQSSGSQDLKMLSGRVGSGYVAISSGVEITTTSALDLNSAAFTLDASTIAIAGSSTVDIDAAGALSLNSSAGAINIGSDSVSQQINVGTAGARTIAVGSSAATAVNVNAQAIALTSVNALTLSDGTASFAFNGTGATALSGATTVDIDATGDVAINSSGGAINIGNDANAQGINVGTAGARAIHVGSASSTSVTVDAVAVSIDATAASNFTVTPTQAGDDFTIALAGSTDSSLVLSSSGTNASDALQLTASVGGMQLSSAKTMAIATSANNANVTINAHGTGAVTMANRRLIVDNTNIRDSMEHVEIVPCDSSVFGSNNLAPVVMSSAQYNGWNAKNSHASGSNVAWTITPAASLLMSNVEFVTVCVKLTSVTVLPVLKLTIGGAAYTFIRNVGALALSAGDIMQFVMPVSGTYSATSPANKYGHKSEQLVCSALSGASGSLTNMIISSSDIDANMNFIVNSVNFVTNTDYGTLSYKFTNDSVVQAQSAQAVSALYKYLFQQQVSQTSSTAIEQTEYAGFVGTSAVYGSASVIANYQLRSIAYSASSYNIASSVANATVVATAPTSTNFTPTSFSMTAVSGLTISGAGQISKTGALTAGIYDVIVTATDANSNTAFDSIAITIV